MPYTAKYCFYEKNKQDTNSNAVIKLYILQMRDPQKPLVTIRLFWRGEHYDSLVEQGMLLYSQIQTVKSTSF